jgi:hypothetical protein
MEEAEAITQGPLFSTYSKNPNVAFDNTARLARKAEIEQALGSELDVARSWIAKNGADAADVVAALERRALR